MDNACLFCGGLVSDPDHWRTCDGRQGAIEAQAAGLGFTPGTGPHHDGETYEAVHDHVRLNAQTLRVWHVMKRGEWLTLRDISVRTGDPEASVSARLRDLRKSKFGGHVVERLRAEHESGLFFYRVVPGSGTEPDEAETEPATAGAAG